MSSELDKTLKDLFSGLVSIADSPRKREQLLTTLGRHKSKMQELIADAERRNGKVAKRKQP